MSKGNAWSIEHIIPYSLGNRQLYIDTVCKKCNNSLGRYVDDYLVNHMFMKVIRHTLKLKGESGKVPIPFEEGIDTDGNRVRLDVNFKPSIVPKLTREDQYHYVGVAGSKEQAKEMILKSLTRNGVEKAVIDSCLAQIDNTEINTYSPKIQYNFSMEKNRFFLAALKIAYEYSYYKLGDEYLEDPRAIEIKNTLNCAISGYMKDKCDFVYGVSNIPEKISEILLHLDDIKVHILMLHSDAENRMICEVILFSNSMFSFSVLVSNDAGLYSGIPLAADEIIFNTALDN